jgi:regulatory protein
VSSADSGDPVQEARDWLRQQTGGKPPQGAESPPADGRPEVESRPSRASVPDSAAEPVPGPAADPEAERVPAPIDEPAADPDADPEAVARAILVRKLAAQDRTRHELATAMAARNVPDAVAAQLLDRFEAVGLVDDQAFARRWVESRQGRRHRSRLALRRELAGKGVDRAVVDEAVSQVSSDDELAAARAYCDKVAHQMSALEPAVRRRRLADRLARRGFGADVIGRVLKDSCFE